MTPGPVKQLALDKGLPVLQPKSLKSAAVLEAFRAHDLSVLVVAAYGLILPRDFLAAPSYGCINVHASLLPRWRGAAPVERAIMAGDPVTGVSIMQMEAGLDTGPVYATRERPITDTDTGATVEADLAELGAGLLIEVLTNLATRRAIPQDEGQACYAAKLTARDADIRWDLPATAIARQARALNARLPATSALRNTTVKVLAAGVISADDTPAQPPGTIVSVDKRAIVVATGQGQLAIHQLRINRGKGGLLSAADAANGYPDLFTPGARFDPPRL